MEVYEDDVAPLTKVETQRAIATDTDKSRVLAEVQGAIVLARQFPRDPIKVRDRVVNAFTRKGLAEKATYLYARGGQNVTGPSIRAAETIIQNWGNCSFGIRELEQRYGESTVEAFAWDYETNVRQSRTFQVSHKIGTKKGMKTLEDPRDIYELVANQGARRMRACILSVIPGDVVEEALAQAAATLRANVTITPETIKSLLEKFEVLGVTKAAIEANIQRHIDKITPPLMLRLASIYNSLNDGMSEPSDWFEIAPVVPTDGAGVASRAAQATELLRRGSQPTASASDAPVPAAAPKRGRGAPSAYPAPAATTLDGRPIVQKDICLACERQKGEAHADGCPIDEASASEVYGGD